MRSRLTKAEVNLVPEERGSRKGIQGRRVPSFGEVRHRLGDREHDGPHILWLTEPLSDVMDLKPRKGVLEMGCGKAVSSIFLAKEFDLRVWRADLRTDASDNWARSRDAGVQDQISPIHAEAHDLPFARDFLMPSVAWTRTPHALGERHVTVQR